MGAKIEPDDTLAEPDFDAVLLIKVSSRSGT